MEMVHKKEVEGNRLSSHDPGPKCEGNRPRWSVPEQNEGVGLRAYRHSNPPEDDRSFEKEQGRPDCITLPRSRNVPQRAGYGRRCETRHEGTS